jgi:hypothetical protein
MMLEVKIYERFRQFLLAGGRFCDERISLSTRSEDVKERAQNIFFPLYWKRRGDTKENGFGFFFTERTITEPEFQNYR